MAIARYLAMTADEFAADTAGSGPIAWMACHFSPYSTSLSNLPQTLPDNSLLILNDSTPPEHQNPKIIAKILDNTVKDHNCSGILLDFQRADRPATKKIVGEILHIGLPVCVSECYAKELDCPIFLPPLPLRMLLTDYISPWHGRDIWLDVALSSEQVTITGSGCGSSFINTVTEYPHTDEALHCRYAINVNSESAQFILHRTKEDLEDLITEADGLGIKAAVGLYQELK